MARIYKRGDRWYIYVTHKGHRIRKSIGTSKALAQKYQSTVEADLTRGELGIDIADCSLKILFSEYLEYSAINHRPATMIRYKGAIGSFLIFLAHLYPDLKRVSRLNLQIFEKYKQFRKTVDPKDINDQLPDDLKFHTKRSSAKTKTINLELKILKSIFTFGIKRGLCSVNPAAGISYLKVDDANAPRFLSKDECQMLLDSAECYYDMIITFLNTGLRLGELLNLQWGDIDFARRRLMIRNKPDWKPKSGEREIPLNGTMIAILTGLKSKKAARTDYVFKFETRSNAGRIIRNKIEVICREKNIPPFRIHDLRHTFASQLVMAGVDLPTVQRLLGHRDIKTTMIYAHLAPDHLANAVEKIDMNAPNLPHPSNHKAVTS